MLEKTGPVPELLEMIVAFISGHHWCTIFCGGCGVSGGGYIVHEDGLEILNATYSDAGNYTCRAEVDEYGNYAERFISVAVNSAFFCSFVLSLFSKLKWLHKQVVRARDDWN